MEIEQFLDTSGLNKYHNEIDTQLIRRTTQVEYNAMTDEQKRGAYMITDAPASSGSSGEDSFEIYDDQERVIGTWFGKPLYRKVISTRSSSKTSTDKILNDTAIFDLSSISCDFLVEVHGVVEEDGGIFVTVPQATAPISVFGIFRSRNSLMERHYFSGDSDRPLILVLTYTKTTD